MKALIIYGTKTGTTEKCAGKIREALGSDKSDLLNVRRVRKADLSSYDTVIVGTPIYMGQINSRIKGFLERESAVLMGKKLHFFICGLARGQEGVDLFKKQVAGDLFSHASQTEQFGCEVNFDRMNPFYRMIMKKIVAEQKPEIGLCEDKIIAFSEKIFA